MNIGDTVVVKNFAARCVYGKRGRIKGFDSNIQPGEQFAVLDIKGTEYCFNVKDLAAVGE